MIPFTCELNKVNIAGAVRSFCMTGLLSAATSWDDCRETLLRSIPIGLDTRRAKHVFSLVLTAVSNETVA